MNIGKLITDVIVVINEVSGNNQMIAGAISLWLLGIVTYCCRSIPLKLWHLLVKHLTTEMTITNSNQSYYDILKWIEINGYADKFRRINFTNGKWGEDEEIVKSVGYGSHIMWHKWRPIRISREREQNQHSRDKEIIHLTRLGRSHKPFDNLLNELHNIHKNTDGKTEVYIYRDEFWDLVGTQPIRPLNTIMIEDAKLDNIVNLLKNFDENEDWYTDHGIPYQIGILLHGPPGTGKTSLVRALAGHLDKSLYIATVDKISNINGMLSRCEKDSIIVLEDIDSCMATHKRNEKEGGDTTMEAVKALSKNSLSDLLNAIDGVMVKHGRILIMTTNHIEKLDDALIRPGRVDSIISIGYLNDESFMKFINTFFPDNNTESFELLDDINLTGAQLQGDILMKKPLEDILKEYCKTTN